MKANSKLLRFKEVPASVEDAGVEDKIRQRAYELYEQRRHQDGHELQDWLQAAAEVKRNAIAA